MKEARAVRWVVGAAVRAADVCNIGGASGARELGLEHSASSWMSGGEIPVEYNLGARYVLLHYIAHDGSSACPLALKSRCRRCGDSVDGRLSNSLWSSYEVEHA